jgi:signal transduction histidine kinase
VFAESSEQSSCLESTRATRAGNRLNASIGFIHSHEVVNGVAEYGEWVDDWRSRLEPYVGDILLATAIAVAAASAASGATSEQPQQTILTALAFLAASTFVVRRVYPVLVLAIVVVVTAFFTAVYGGYWPFAAILAFYSVAAHSPRRTALVAGIVGLVALAIPIASLEGGQGPESLSPDNWSQVALFAGRLAPLVAAWILGDNMRTRRAYIRAVEDRAEQLEREQEANARRAAAEEQARIAREVHDVVAHNLSVIIVQATAAERVFGSDPRSAERAVKAVGRTARQALDELRGVLGVAAETDLAPQPTLASLDPLIEQVRAAGLDVVLETEGTPRRLPSPLELSAFRIVQEALTNTLRHANAQSATVRVRYGGDALTVEVVDDGVAQNGTGGRGLIGMRERAASFGGEVETGPDADGGFRVAARLPVGVLDE